MGTFYSKTTSQRWKLVDFNKQWDEACHAEEKTLFGNTFNLGSRSSIKFALYVNTNLSISERNSVGVVLKEFGDSNQVMKVSAKIWIENVKKQKFGETFIQSHVFNKIGDQCGFNGLSDEDKDAFYELYDKNETFFICCELAELSVRRSDSEHFQDFQQNQWDLYKQGVHDSIIKIGNSEFKVLKGFFMAHSEVFKCMFQSNFKEGRTCVIELKDISEKTMKQLIRWFYTSKIDDEENIEELFEASDKYDINLLKETCIEIILTTMNSDNVFPRLILSVMHNNYQLKEATLDYISGMSADDRFKLVLSDEWLEFNRKQPKIANEVVALVREKFKF